MGILDFLKTDTFKSWKDVRSGLKCLDTERYRKQLEFLLREGFESSLTSAEKNNLHECIAHAAAGNLKPLKDLSEPTDSAVTPRMCSWLDHVYNSKGHVSTPREGCSLVPIAVSAPTLTHAAIEKVYRFVSETSGEPYTSGIIADLDQAHGSTWREKLAHVMGRPWVISNTTLLLENALCIPSMADAFSTNPRLGMIHWEKEQLIVLNGQAIMDGVIPPQPITRRLDPQELGNKLRSQGWELEVT